ncbi:MAG: Ig-like domain-containing protein [Candidatus Riflebacteria bacterium]|nr:Ig-like domain-containing protein [Candidatus Riflebacteria bacterium]
MKLVCLKWLQACVAVVAVVALLVVGCGGGGGGGDSDATKPIARTLTGSVMVPSSPSTPASLQDSLRMAAGMIPVMGAKVWLEGHSEINPEYTDASGTYTFHGVPADSHFVIASFNLAGQIYKQRVRSVVQNDAANTTAPVINLTESKTVLTGILKDSAGNFLPAGTEMKLWGEIFTVGSNGRFTTPPLPVSENQAQIFVKTPGASTFSSFYGPFIAGTTPAFIEQTVLPPTSTNQAPSGVLVSKNTAGIETISCVTGEQMNISLTSYDSDATQAGLLKYTWSASRGTLQVAAGQKSATWIAMDSYGVATISVLITDPESASGKVSLRMLVNIQSMDETDTTSPTIVSRTPAANTIGVTPDSTISVVFSEVLLASSATSGAMAVTSQGTAVSGSSALQADKKTMIWTPATSLPGNQTITVDLSSAISDLYGNQIGAQNTWTFTTALIPGVTVKTLYTNDPTPEITGTVDDPEATVRVTVNSRTYNATLEGTSWKAQITDTLPDATYNVSAVATNKAGIAGNDSTSSELTIDTGIKIAVLSNLPPVVTSSTQTAINVGGTGVVRYLFRYRMSGEDWSAWSAEKPVSEKIVLTGLVDGMHSLQVRAIDAVGNLQSEVAATTFEWTIDTTVKVAQFDATTLPQNPTNQTTTNIKVIGNGVQFYRFRLNEGSWSVNYPITTSIKLVSLKSGANVINLIGGDSYGNWQSITEPTVFSWVIDANIKTAVLDNKPTNPTNISSASIIIGGEGVTRYKYSTDGGASWSAEALVSVNDRITLNGLADGAHSVQVVGGDDLGTWQSTANATIWSWVVDTVIPTVNLTSTVADVTNVPVPVSIAFSEPVTAFELTTLDLENCYVSNLHQIVAGKEWTFDISPIEAGPVSVTLPTGAVSDFAGNSTAEDVQLSFVYDSDKPLATLSPSEILPTNAAVTITLHFDTPVDGFELNDLTIVNCVPSNLETIIEKQEWRFLVTPSVQGEVTVSLAADKVTDVAGNGNTAANQIKFVYDSVIPTVALSTTSSSPSRDNPITVTIKFSEEIIGFVLGDVTVGNGIAGNLQVIKDNKEWSIDVTPPAEGEVTVNIAAGVVADAAGNPNTAALPLAITCDSVRPSVVSLTTTETNPTSNSPIPVTIQFGEAVSGFQLTHLTISNGTAGNLQVGMVNNSFTFDVTPTTNGVVTINLLENKVTDPAGNGNFAAVFPLSINYDSVQPTATFVTTANASVNALPITVTIEFNKDIIDFDLSDLTIGNGNATSLSQITPFRKWSFLVNTSSQGAITVDLAANIVHDSAGNGNKAANQIGVIFDSISPTVNITSTASASTNLSSIPIRIEFSENVSGFDISDLQIDNYTAVSTLQTVTAGRVWSTTITPAAPGNVSVALSADIATDAAGNGNTAATTLVRNYDIERPTVTLSTIKPDPTNANPIPVTVTFNEDITGFAISHLVVGNGSAGNLQVAIANRAWTVEITPNAEGFVTVDMAAGNVTDAASNSNEAALQLKRYYDSTKPMPTLALAQGYTSPASGTFKIAVTFNDDVTGFTATDLSVINGSPQNAIEVVASRSWIVEIEPSGGGTYTVDIDLGADKVIDTSGNGNTAAARLSVLVDKKAPTATLTTPETPTSANPIPVTIKFDEPISDFSLADFSAGSLSGCSVTNLQHVSGGTEWTVQVIPSFQGDVSISLPAGKVFDVAGNGNEAASVLTINYNSERPTVVISSSKTSPTNSNPVPITVVFGEAVSGFASTELVIGNGSVSGFSSGDNITWTASITPSINGLVTVDVPANVAVDGGGNQNTAAAQFSVTYDSASPTAVLSTTSPAIIGSGSIPITIKFNEDIATDIPGSFDAADLTVVNGYVASFSGSGKDWTCEIERNPADFQGVVSVTLEAGKVLDPAGNGNAAANTISVTYDSTSPTALLTANVAADTSSKNITVTLSFSKPVESFLLADLDLRTNCTASNLQKVGTENSTWTFIISAIANGLVELQLPAGVASDTAGNGNEVSNTLSWTYDSGKPSVLLAFNPQLTSPVNTSPIGVTVTFSEVVSGFIESELVVVNGSKSGFVESTPGKVWTASITPTLDGMVTVNVAADVATDSADNGNTAASQISVVYDNTPPAPSLTTSAVSPTNASTFPVTITFYENVTGFDISKLNVVNGSVSGDPWVVTANRVWRANIAPDANQVVTVDLLASAAADMAGNSSLATGTLSVTNDSTKPEPTFTTTAGSPASTTVPMTVTFTEPVTGLVTSDFTVSNGYVNNLIGGPSSWTFSLVPTTTGVVTLDLAADKVVDAAGNGNVAVVPQFSIVFDNSKPTVTLSTAVMSPTNNSPIPVTITFSEVIATASFIAGDLVIGNGTAGALTTVDNIVWTVGITPMASGAVTVNLPAGVASDTAGNSNVAAAQLSVTYDATPPSVTLATGTVGLVSPTNISPIRVIIEFSEIIAGFTVGDLVVTNGTTDNLVAVTPNKKWRVDIVPNATGTVTIALPANVATDAAGNNNTAATSLSIVYNTDRPTVVFSSVDGGLNGTATNTSPIPFKVTFSKSIKDGTFTLDDITVTNGTKANLTLLVTATPRTEFTFDVTPASDGAVYVNMAENRVTDETTPTGNFNTAAAQFGRVYDTSSPSVMLSTTTSLTNGTPFEVTVTFDEDVQGGDLTVDDFAVASFSASAVTTVSAREYKVTITPSGDPVKIKLLAGRVRDLVGNYNTESNEITVTYDIASPTITMVSNAPDPTNGNPIPLTITFSEQVVGFTASDLTLVNATLPTGISENSPGRVWSANLVPTGDGLVTVNIPGSVASDTAGNGNAAATQFSRTYDATPPGVTFSHGFALTGRTNTSPIPFKVTFTEPIATSSFALVDITVSGGTAATLTTVIDGLEYGFTVTPSANGTVSVGMAANLIMDLAGNFNLVATQSSVVYDTVQPAVTLMSDKTWTNATFTVTITFNDVIDPLTFDVNDLLCGNCAADIGTFQADPNPANAGRVWTVVMTATTDPATVKINAGTVKDLAGNDNTVSNEITVRYDNGNPGVTLTSTAPDPTNVSPIVVTVTFTEAVTGFAADDMALTNATAGGITPVVAGTTWNVSVVPASTGPITVTVGLNANAVTDLAGNFNAPAAPITRDYDAVRPTVATVSSGLSGTFSVGGSIDIVVAFSETVFVTGTPQLTLETGATDRPATYVSGHGTSALTFTYTVQPGDNSLDLNYNSINALQLSGGSTIRDNAGNNAIITLPALDAAGSLKDNSAIIIDAVGPRVIRVRSSPANTTYTTGSFNIQVEFDEAVTVLGLPNSTLLLNVTNINPGVVASATYLSTAGTTLTYVYAVRSGDKTTTQPNGSLNYTATNALKANDSVFRDIYGNTSTYTLPPTNSVDALITSGIVVVAP